MCIVTQSPCHTVVLQPVFAGLIAIARAGHEVDDEVGYESGGAGRDQLNHEGIGGKYKLDSTYAFGRNRYSLELSRTQVDDDKWDGDFIRDKVKMSYQRGINDALDFLGEALMSKYHVRTLPGNGAVAEADIQRLNPHSCA
ncbi:MAG: hypothetical protein ABGY96_11020 [bacterium]|nr:hypothetical protein [Gammaproteobacteria bacterium]HIL95198.1 hypothetical protein [Pseudomonadales bacterium]